MSNSALFVFSPFLIIPIIFTVPRLVFMLALSLNNGQTSSLKPVFVARGPLKNYP